ncbi:MAG: hypothetical protein ABSB09_00025 [Acidimicrobiales bacterium]|jgi:hypothetical protein
MPISKAKADQLGTWCGTDGAGEFVDQFLNALFAGRSSEAKTLLDPDLGRRSYGHIREALTFLEGEHWMFIPTPGRTPDGCEIVRFVHLNDPEATLERGRPLVLDTVDFEIQSLGNRAIVRIGPKRWETSDLTD